MSTTEVHSEQGQVDLKFEAVVIPVSDVDRAKAFYGGLGWRLDADFAFDNGFRVVQFTPPGSPASLQIRSTNPPPLPKRLPRRAVPPAGLTGIHPVRLEHHHRRARLRAGSLPGGVQHRGR